MNEYLNPISLIDNFKKISPFNRGRFFLFILLNFYFLFNCLPAFCQVRDTLKPAKKDTIKTIDTLSKTSEKSFTKDSIFYNKLQKKMYKKRMTREIYDFLFKNVYNSGRDNREVEKIDENPFIKYEGKIIRSIDVKQLDVFGPSVYDTTHRGNWSDRLGSKIHRNTRDYTIKRAYLLFSENETVRAQVLKDNERLLRGTSIFHDARIIVIPDRKNPGVVDIKVITQDVWSLEPTDIIFQGGSYGLTLQQKNFLGFGHTFVSGFVNKESDTIQKFGYFGRYYIPSINRRNYISAELDLVYLRETKQYGARASRRFLTPETKYAGGIGYDYFELSNYVSSIQKPDSSYSLPLHYTLGDIWLGRAFKLKIGNPEFNRQSKLVVAGKMSKYDFIKRPAVELDSNRLYTNRQTYLFSVGFSNRSYRRDLLIYGFGKTEDVPMGYSASMIGGFENTEFGRRMYYGAKFSRGDYLPRKSGYLYTLLNVGSFFRQKNPEQGVISITSSYFSPLLQLGKRNFRHFISANYTSGFDRFDYEYIDINNSNGIVGVSSNQLHGTKRISLGFESIFFSRLDVIGFRAAVFGFANFGMVNYTNKELFKGTVYQGYGIGFRFRNENFAFNTFQVRIGYYPNIPEIATPLRSEFGDIPSLRFQDFDISEPEVVMFR